MSKQYFHFTLGPVQGFVSQARRTRDFWAGSFILSWLSAVAMKAVQAQYSDKKLEEVIRFPAPDPEFMKWLTDEKDKAPNKKPTQGSIPNRFKALVDENFKPELVTNAVQEAWKALADKVWERDLKNFGQDSKHHKIWERQVAAFWDMAWVVTGDIEDSSALDRRKNWRTYTPSKEAGVKCFMMDGWQELSGKLSPSRNDMNKFWTPLREKGQWGMQSDLAENEALCAIAFIKRRFSRHFEKLDHKMGQGWQLKGWEVPSNVPSVTYMAAVHWLEQLLKEPRPNDAMLEGFHTLAYELTGKQYSEMHTDIQCLKDFKEKPLLKKILALDGNVFFPTELENPRIFSKKDPSKIEQARQTLSALKTLTQASKELKVAQDKKLEPLTPFYAILLMDGDSLGEKMSNKDFQYPITKGLEEFTNKVPCLVYKNNGFLIYAGGDDVLAILPLEDAIPCAVALRKHYMECFKHKAATDKDKERIAVDTTISAAIEFVHIHTPLTKVLKDSHKLLDKVAKDGSGRDALAVRVWKPGGLQIEWSQPWDIALGNPDCLKYSLGKDKVLLSDTEQKKSEVVVYTLAENFKRNTLADKDFSNKFFYKIRERFELLNPPKIHKGQQKVEPVLGKAEAISFMTMEYLNSWGSEKKKDMVKARADVEKLLGQARPVKREMTEAENKLPSKAKPFDQWTYGDDIKADAALLVRFLAQKGVDRT